MSGAKAPKTAPFHISVPVDFADIRSIEQNPGIGTDSAWWWILPCPWFQTWSLWWQTPCPQRLEAADDKTFFLYRSFLALYGFILGKQMTYVNSFLSCLASTYKKWWKSAVILCLCLPQPRIAPSKSPASSSWLPDCTSSPWSRTRILSQNLQKDSLCEMYTTFFRSAIYSNLS